MNAITKSLLLENDAHPGESLCGGRSAALLRTRDNAAGDAEELADRTRGERERGREREMCENDM